MQTTFDGSRLGGFFVKVVPLGIAQGKKNFCIQIWLC